MFNLSQMWRAFKEFKCQESLTQCPELHHPGSFPHSPYGILQLEFPFKDLETEYEVTDCKMTCSSSLEVLTIARRRFVHPQVGGFGQRIDNCKRWELMGGVGLVTMSCTGGLMPGSEWISSTSGCCKSLASSFTHSHSSVHTHEHVTHLEHSCRTPHLNLAITGAKSP